MRFVSILCFLAVATIVYAQDKKEPPKQKKEPPSEIKTKTLKLVVTDAAKAGPDFAVQGEYEDVSDDKYKIGTQVIARGDGNFVVRMLKGGLPGTGWDGQTEQLLTAKTMDGRLIVTGIDPFGGEISGTIENGKLTFSKDEDLTLARVERKSPTLGEKPPDGAIVLFEKPEDIDKWNGAKIMELPDGKFLTVGGANFFSKDTFKNFKLHLEFRLAYMPHDTAQARSISGIYLQNIYELRILDSFGMKSTNIGCGSFNLRYAPLVNMCYPPLTWQTYDIVFTAAEFDMDSKCTKPAHATVRQNGVLVQDNVELKDPTDPSPKDGGQKPNQKQKDNPGQLRLAWRGAPVVFRNIWMVETK